MSGIALKLSSLAIRTLSKPIGNLIKRQAKEHEGFRRVCISFAQSLHRLDMRLRLGLLRDSAEIEKQIAREAAEAQAKKHKHSIPTVKTEAQTRADEAAATRAKEKAEAPAKTVPKPKIRPLSEAKAIESGATFISEAFLFAVAGGLIFFESWRSRRKETSHREDVSDRLAELEESEKAARRGLVELEREILRLRAKEGKVATNKRILPREVYEVEAIEETEDEAKNQGWLGRIASYVRGKKGNEDSDTAAEQKAPDPPKAPVEPTVKSSEESHHNAQNGREAAASSDKKA